jgi:uncharacterized 2Fe-2S/4Fe-4S cluster protein (DUF4445 family)
MPIVTFLPSYRKVEVDKGTTILEAAQKANLNLNVVCGGQGKCGKCVIYRKSGETEFDQDKYAPFFTPEERARGASLACKTMVLGDVYVEVPESTLIQEQKILEESKWIDVPVLSSVTKFYVEMSPPTLEDPSPDLTRLLWRIEKQGGPSVRKIFAPLPILRELSRTLRENNWKVTATVAIVPGGYRLIHIEGGDTRDRLYGAAVDLGTTSIVVTVRSLIDGSIVGVASNYNRQISIGEDILSRVNYARKSGLSRLRQLAAESINRALHSACDVGKIDMDDIFELEIAGNTVMTHLLLEIDPEYMISEPYVPVVRRSIYTTAENLSLDVHRTAGVYFFPSVSNFIGGDVIGDILTCGMGEREEISLLVDMGTNFEVVLGNRDWMFSCAGAAGPALEGAEVLFGMRANPGAIEKVRIETQPFRVYYETINQIKPRGICGSGMIDLLAELLRSCYIDRTGRLDTTSSNPRIRQGTYYPEFVVVPKDETGIGKDIVITENDIQNLIMSKAAILAACYTLMDAAGVKKDDIGMVYLAGAFGNYLNRLNAITIGLIPEVPVDRITTIGNGALAGANIALINREKRNSLDTIAHEIAYIELNADPTFMDRYTSSCFLPHTDLSLFPTVEKMLAECRLRKED